MPNKRSSRTSLPPSSKLLAPNDVVAAKLAVELIVSRDEDGALAIVPLVSTVSTEIIECAVARVAAQL